MADLDDLCGRMLGEFVLRERLDEGGFGAVYRCEQPLLGREAVVKVLHKRMRHQDAALQRFMREARFASRLDHPYAAHVYAFGVDEDDGLLWIAMELVQGITLNRWLQTRGPLPLEQLVPFFDRVAEVVQAAHERGIVHRDLKPSNVMVIERAGRLLPKLLDFGVAKLLEGVVVPSIPSAADAATQPGAPATIDSECDDDPAAEFSDAEIPPTDPDRTVALRRRAGTPTRHDRLTRASAAIGSPPYMSPEQWTDPTAVGPASDLYALGVIAYEALTGRRPYIADTIDEYGNLHRNAPIPSLGPGFSPTLDKFFQRALAKNPEDRWGSALDLAAALRSEWEARMLTQIRSSARQWNDRGRPNGLLWRDDVLADLERWMGRTGVGALTPLEAEFCDASRQHEILLSEAARRRAAWARRGIAAFAVALVGLFLGAVQYRAMLKAQMAEDLAEATITQSEVEQGRQALLHGESSEAVRHLGSAYQRGDHSSATEFMYARALQPRRAELARFNATFGRMWSASFSPDGRRIVTSDDQNAQVWNAETNQLLFTLPHSDNVYDAKFSDNGSILITASRDGFVRIWDANNGSLLRRLTYPSDSGNTVYRYRTLALSHDGSFVAATDEEGQLIHVWDPHTGAVLAGLSLKRAGFPGIEFSADNRWLAAIGEDGVSVFDTLTWVQTLTLSIPGVRCLDFSPTSPLLAVGTTSGEASTWSVPDGKRVRHLHEVGEAINAIAFSPDGEFVATGAGDGGEQVWSANSGELRSQFNALRTRVLSMEFDPTSKLLVAAGAAGSVAVSEAVTGGVVAVLEGPQVATQTAHFDLASRRVIGSSVDGTARIWAATSSYRRWSSPPIADGCAAATGVDVDRRFLAVTCRDYNTRIWDTANDRLLAELPSVTRTSGDYNSAFAAVSSIGDRAAIARNNTVEVYAVPGSNLLYKILHSAPVSAVAFAPQGGDLVSGSIDGIVKVTRTDGTSVTLPRASSGVDVVGFLADGRVVVTDVSRTIHVYASDATTLLAEFTSRSRTKLLRSSADSRFLVTVPSFRKADPPELWDLSSYREVAPLQGHVGQVWSARFVRDNSAILTAGGDGTARLWEVSTGRLIQTYSGSTRFLTDASMDSSGTMVVAGGGDGMLRFWDARTSNPLWTLSAHKPYVVGIHFEGSDIVTRGYQGDVARWYLPKPQKVIEACDARELAVAERSPCGTVPQ